MIASCKRPIKGLQAGLLQSFSCSANAHALSLSGRLSIQSRSQRLRSFWSAPSIRPFPVRWIRVTHALGTRLVSIFRRSVSRCIRYLVFLSLVERFSQLAYICARIILCYHRVSTACLLSCSLGIFSRKWSVTLPLLRVTLSPWEVRCVAFYVNFYRK